MKIPKRIKIVANNSGRKYYDRYIGDEYDVLQFDDSDSTVLLKTPNEYGDSNGETWWEQSEIEFLEWAEEEIPDVEEISATVTISRKEYEELLEYKAIYEGLDR